MYKKFKEIGLVLSSIKGWWAMLASIPTVLTAIYGHIEGLSVHESIIYGIASLAATLMLMYYGILITERLNIRLLFLNGMMPLSEATQYTYNRIPANSFLWTIDKWLEEPAKKLSHLSMQIMKNVPIHGKKPPSTATKLIENVDSLWPSGSIAGTIEENKLYSLSPTREEYTDICLKKSDLRKYIKSLKTEE